MDAVALVTCRKVPELSESDRILAAAIERRGYAARPAVWDDPRIDWSAHAAVIIRSTWDYHLRVAEFRSWLTLVEQASVPVFNPTALVRWNLAKTYLRDLAERGIPTVPTRWLRRGEAPSLRAVLDERGWRDAVVKPVVSASSHGTRRVSAATVEAEQPEFSRMLAGGDVMVQPFIPEVLEGEWSMVFFGGRFSHAAVKRPAPGEFRVQTEFGGTVEATKPPPDLVADAERVLAAAPVPALYARVDGCRVDGRFTLMELEVIEPHLFFEIDAGAADRCAGALAQAIAREN